MAARTGRMPCPGDAPSQELTLTAEEQATLTGWTRRPTTAQALALRARIVLGAAEGRSNKDDRGDAADHRADGRQVAPTVPRRAPRRSARRAAAGGAADDRRRRRRAGDRAHPGVGAARRDPLEHPLDGRRDRLQPELDQPDLAGLRPRAPPERDVQAVHRSAVHREGPRHRRAVPRAARAGARALGRREDPDPGARPDGADAAACARARSSATPTTTSAMARRACSPPSTWRPAR